MFHKLKERALFIWLTCITLLVIGICFGIYENNALEVTKYQVNLGLSREYRMVHISDLHNKAFGTDNEKLVKRVMQLEPDCICITGDVVDAYHTNTEVAIHLAKQLVEIAPVYYVTGNHERALPEQVYHLMETEFEQAGVKVLFNCIEQINDEIQMIGLDEISQPVDAESIKKILECGREGKKNILLVHEPQYFEQYAAVGLQLVLSGHAHGGQVRIPFTDIALVAPGQGFFPKYTSGVYQKADTSMVVSRGLGNSILPLRIFNRPELIEITLQ